MQPSRTNKDEPTPDVYLPTPPEWLSDLAKKYWAEIGAVLLSMKLCTVADGPAMQLMTEALAEWAEARQAVYREGLVYETTTESGSLMRRANPEVAQAADAMRRAMRMLTEFGLTPASRSKVSALGGKDGGDPFDEIMNDMKG
ncbi:MAG: phage terminase small subunit P27 family [Janthinobacterium lividum]